MSRLLRPIAIAASLALHAGLLIQAGGAIGVSEPVTQAQSITRLTFSKPAPLPEEVPMAAPEPQPENQPKPEPKPVARPEKAVPEKREPEPKAVAEKPQPARSVAATAAQTEQAPQLDDGMIENKTKAYLASVIAHIEQHKWYPKAARRRGIEGDIEVTFLLLPDGSANAVEVTSGPEVLLEAARKTMARATPLPPPPPDIHCPIRCSFRMQFALDAS